MEGSTHGTKGLMEIPQRPGASAAVSIPQPAAAERPRARSPGNSVHAGDCVRTVIGRGVMPNEDNLRSMLKSLLSRGRRERWLLPPEVRVRVRLRAALIYSARARYPGRCAGCVGGGFICVCVPQQWSVLRVSAWCLQYPSSRPALWGLPLSPRSFTFRDPPLFRRMNNLTSPPLTQPRPLPLLSPQSSRIIHNRHIIPIPHPNLSPPASYLHLPTSFLFLDDTRRRPILPPTTNHQPTIPRTSETWRRSPSRRASSGR